MMKLIINGKDVELDAETLQDVIKLYDLPAGLVVAEIDGEIIDRNKWETTNVSHGMVIELVHFVGGG